MCYDLIAAHKVESMCAAQRTGMRHLEHSSGSTGEQALNISHISHQGISGSHQASLCLWIIWSILEGWRGGSHLGVREYLRELDPNQPQAAAATAKQEEAANISHISQQGISGCHQASPCLCLANLEHLQPGRRGLTGRNFISACTSMRLCTRGGGSYQQSTINYFDGTHPAEI